MKDDVSLMIMLIQRSLERGADGVVHLQELHAHHHGVQHDADEQQHLEQLREQLRDQHGDVGDQQRDAHGHREHHHLARGRLRAAHELWQLRHTELVSHPHAGGLRRCGQVGL